MNFCTIITANFAHYALALHDSLIKFNPETVFSIFISEGELTNSNRKEFGRRSNLNIYYYEDLKANPVVKDLKNKYYIDYHDAYRWGMKPLFLKFLLKRYQKVIYLDSDLYFFNNCNFFLDKLDSCDILLTPHWRSINPKEDYSNFVHNFRDGIYNAGFIGVSSGAEIALDWWAKMILFKCEVDRNSGYYVDQRYLDLLPVYFDKVKILKHKGCNVANWNMLECRRTNTENGEVLINNEYPIIFIHFTNSMFTGIYYHGDDLLIPFLEKYRDNLLKYSSVDIIEQYFEKGRFKKPRSENDFIVNEKTSRIERSIKLIKRIYRKLK